MKRLMVLAAFALVASLVFAAVAVAEQAPVEEAAGQEEVLETPAEEAAEEPVEEAVGADQAEAPAEEAFEEQAEQSAEGQVETTVTDDAVITEATVEAPSVAQPEQTMMMESTQPLPSSGGLGFGSILLPAAALLLGGGVLAFAVLRRR